MLYCLGDFHGVLQQRLQALFDERGHFREPPPDGRNNGCQIRRHQCERLAQCAAEPAATIEGRAAQCAKTADEGAHVRSLAGKQWPREFDGLLQCADLGTDLDTELLREAPGAAAQALDYGRHVMLRTVS